MGAPSFQAIHARRRQSVFVGRNVEVSLFRENLELAPDDERRRFIFNVFGQGGVGKTTLLQNFRRLAREAEVATAWTDDAETEVYEVMDRLASDLSGREAFFDDFKSRLQRYVERRGELEADPEYLGLAGLVGGAVGRTGVLLARRAPVVGAVFAELDTDTVAKQSSELATFLARRFKNKDDVRLMREPSRVLTPLFLKGVRELGEERAIALFVDTYERTSSHLDSWLREVLEGQFGDVPGNFVLVVAGRNELDRNLWAPFEDLLEEVDLEPFTGDDARDFLARKEIDDPAVAELILELSGGLPLLLATLAAGKPMGVGEVGEVSDTAVERFLSWVEEPQQRNLGVAGAFPRSLNRDLVDELVEEAPEAMERLFQWLVSMPFVIKRRHGWSYHEVVRKQMLRHSRRSSPRGWQGLHNRLAAFFERLQEETGLTPEEGPKDKLWSSYAQEIIYHRLCAAPQGRLADAVQGFVGVSRTSRRLWAETVQQAGEDSEAQEVEEWGEHLRKIAVALDEEDYRELGGLLGKLVQFPGLKDEECSKVLAWRGVAYGRTERYEEALADFKHLLELQPDDARALFNKGASLGALGRSEEAIEVYDQVAARYGERDELPLAEQVARALVNKGASLGALERIEEAIEVYDQVAALYGERAELPLAEKVARALVYKGASLGALERSEEAIEVFDQLAARYGERAELPLAEQVARALFNKGASLGALERSEEEIEVYDQLAARYGERDELPLAELVARALDNKGSSLLLQGSSLEPGSEDQRHTWQQAETVFVRYSERTGRPLQQVYNYACLLALRQEIPQALEALRECFKAGMISVEHVRGDSDWDSFRSDPDFEDLLETYDGSRNPKDRSAG